jgi:DNA transposition AAA+ family ATPase
MSDAAKKIDDELLEENHGAEVSAGRAETARSWLKEFRKQEGLEKIALSRRLGFGDNGRSRVHKFLEGQDDPGLVLAAERLRATVDGPDGISAFIGWKATRTAKTVIEFATKVRSGGLFGAIVGPVGAGKSEALKKFEQSTRGDGLPRVRILRARSTMHLAGLVRTLASDMGIKGGEISRLHSEIVSRVSARPEFWIVDEVDYLLHKERSLHFLRDVHDESGIGVLFSGQLYFLRQVWERANRGAAGIVEEGRLSMSGPLAAFADRLRVQIAPGLDDEEVIAIAQDVLKVTLTDEAAKRLIVYVNHDFRVLSLLISVMRDVRQRIGKTCDHRVVEACWTRAMHVKSRQ